MTTALHQEQAKARTVNVPVIAIAGKPNAGKTTLFNALTGLRAKTSNFPGTTIECRTSRTKFGDEEVELLDLPGLYSLNDCSDEEKLAGDALQGRIEGREKPAGIIVVADATNLERNLYLAGQILEMNLPVVVALTMMDLARREQTSIDTEALSLELGCPIVSIDGRAGSGFEGLREECERMLKGQIASTSMPERL
ncbi:MAG: 50S ribosome-binding GTPase, partial [Verrucomicrobia bacterium]|nr:50S ribosome-binding GTPase [Verrucomicrobiota bacterium]